MNILDELQHYVADRLAPHLSAYCPIIPENRRDIDYEIKSAMGKQGMCCIVMTPKATFAGAYEDKSLAWQIDELEIDIIENVTVNRGKKTGFITGQDASMRLFDVLCPLSGDNEGMFNAVSYEEGEDNSLLVNKCVLKCLVHGGSTTPPYFPDRQGIKFADGTFVPVGDDFFALGNSTTIQNTIQNLGYSISDLVEIDVFSYLNNANGYRDYLKNVYIDESCPQIGHDIWGQPFAGQNLEKVVFKGRTYAEIQQMQYYPWGLTDLTKIIALDDTVIPTKVKYTEASGLPDWEGDIMGQLSATSIPDISSMQSIDIGNRVTSIGTNVFRNCSSLTDVTIPSNVTSIGARAFDGCSGLTNVTIGNNVTSIGVFAFLNCTNLTSVTIPDNVTSIGTGTFYYCTGLTSVTIGNSVTSIGASSFWACRGLTSLTIPSSVTSIENFAFSGCIGLTSVTIPESVTSIGESTFADCTSLKNINSNDGVYLYDGIQTIGQRAFQNSGIEKLSFDNTIAQGIHRNAFSGCNQLTEVVVRGVTTHEAMSLENYPWGISNENIIRGDRGI